MVLVIRADGEADGVVGEQREGAGDGTASAVDGLVENRLAEGDGSVLGLDGETAVGIEAGGLGAGEVQADGSGVGVGGDDEVVFELALVAVVHKIDAVIHPGILHLGEGGDGGVPLGGVVAQNIVGGAGQLIGAGGLRGWIGAPELHTNQVGGDRCGSGFLLVERERGARHAQGDAVNVKAARGIFAGEIGTGPAQGEDGFLT